MQCSAYTKRFIKKTETTVDLYGFKRENGLYNSTVFNTTQTQSWYVVTKAELYGKNNCNFSKQYYDSFFFSSVLFTASNLYMIVRRSTQH